MIDTLVRGGSIVTTDGVHVGDVAIEGGRIAAVGTDLGPAREVIDAKGLYVLPAVIDVHVHFNEPGRADWEGAASGSRALAAGGGTLFFDMPLNSAPCTVTPRDFDAKCEALTAASITDFALWGALVPGAIGEMAGMAERGVVGYKAFMCDSGLPEFPRADDRTLFDGFAEAARLGLPVAVHAENDELTRLRSRAGGAASTSRRSGEALARAQWAQSRPVAAEVDAIQRALLFAEETGVRLHIVHVSSGRGVAAAAEAQARGVDVTVETCPHYLSFTEADVERLGAAAKCAPPLRSHDVQDALWRELLDGHVDIVASDHSPAPPSMKERPFADAWGGIAGVQFTLSVLLQRTGADRGVPLERVVTLTSAAPARRFGIIGKGAISAGADADLAIVDRDASFVVDAASLQQRHKQSPYIGQRLRGIVKRTIRRGETIWHEGRITATGGGRLVRPARDGAVAPQSSF